MFAKCFEEGKHPRNAAGTSTITPSAALTQVRGLQLWDIFHPRISQHVTCAGDLQNVQILLSVSCRFSKWRNRDAEHRELLNISHRVGMRREESCSACCCDLHLGDTWTLRRWCLGSMY